MSSNLGEMTPPKSGRTDIDRTTTRSTSRHDRAYLPIALVVTVATWVGLFLQRGAAHTPNIDDYGYAALAYRLGHLLVSSPGKGIHSVLHTGQTAPLVPLLAAGPSHLGGVQGAVSIEVIFLILLVCGAYQLARYWLGPAASSVAALVVGMNQAVMSWALMFNFALSTTAATVWAFASYLHSDHLKKRGWSVVLGFSVGFLLVSRTLAVVYAAPLALVIVVDLLWFYRDRLTQLPWINVAIITGLVLVIAAPWWAVSGQHAFRYLRGTGYQSGVGLSPSAIGNRLYWTIYDLGRFESVALGIALVAFAVLLVTRRPKGGGRLLIAVWSVMVLIALSTSHPGGTGFALPVISLVIVMVASVLPSSRLITAAVCAVLALGVASQVTGTQNQWWLGPPYSVEALEVTATGNGPVADFDALEQRLLGMLGGRQTVLTRDDNAVNAGGLNWFSIRQNRPLDLIVAPYGGENALTTVARELQHSTFLVTGTSPSPYHQDFSQQAVKQIATREGFAPYRVLWINAKDIVQIWKRQA